MWGWVSEILKGLAHVLKIIFGTDQIHKNTIIDKDPGLVPGPSRSRVLRDLGVRESGPQSGDPSRDRPSRNPDSSSG